VLTLARGAHSVKERDEFEKYDKEHQVRAKLIDALKAQFPDWNLTYSIGGQISFDVLCAPSLFGLRGRGPLLTLWTEPRSPNGWDKRFALGHVEKEGFKEIHFFGDKTFKGASPLLPSLTPRLASTGL